MTPQTLMTTMAGPRAAAMALALAVLAPVRAADGACAAQSGAQAVQLVELYTSEGCNSCPPADRWLSTLRGRPGVLALAFHVDYWDQLGWPDRFAQPAFSARQRAVGRHTGAGFVYTPQVLVNGRDWRGWPTLPVPGAPSRVELGLARGSGDAVTATVKPLDGAPPRLTLAWALLEDGHSNAVRAGENRGVTLRHDHVVRQWHDEGPVGTRRQWTLPAPRGGEGGRTARLVLVVSDADTGLPVQALALDC